MATTRYFVAIACLLCACSSNDFQNPVRKHEPSSEAATGLSSASSSQTDNYKTIEQGKTTKVDPQNKVSVTLKKKVSSDEAREQVTQLFIKKLLGKTENLGNNDSPEIREVLAPVGLVQEAYCAATVSWLYQKVGIAAPYTAWSPSLFPPKYVIYRKGVTISLEGVNKADVFGLFVAKKGRIGHAGIFANTPESKSKWCYTYEGNTSDEGSLDNTEGDGFHAKMRSKREIYIVSSFIQSDSVLINQ